MTLVAGVDSSTQSTKIVVVDADTGDIVREGRAPHPDGTQCPPAAWWQAFEQASAGLLNDVAAIAVAGQQHGMVLVDDEGALVRDALLWNDTRSASAAEELIVEGGGAKAWADAVGSVPVASFTVTKLRWVAQHEPDVLRRASSVMLPHDFLTWRLLGSTQESMVTDRGDASGTGYWSPITEQYRDDLLQLAAGRQLQVPRVARPNEQVGVTSSGVVVGPGTGDNMAAALGVGARGGDLIISLGTSGTAFAVSEVPTRDSSGAIAGFADATGRWLPLIATLNAARVLSAGAQLLGVSLEKFSDLALAAPAGADGLTLLPYLDGERTPNLPDASGSLHGITRANFVPENLARACIEGMLCGLANAADQIAEAGVEFSRILLVGGAAASPAVQQIAAGLFGGQVYVPEPAEYVALGASRQAAWALSQSPDAPEWVIRSAKSVSAESIPEVRNRYSVVAAS